MSNYWKLIAVELSKISSLLFLFALLARFVIIFSVKYSSNFPAYFEDEEIFDKAELWPSKADRNGDRRSEKSQTLCPS